MPENTAALIQSLLGNASEQGVPPTKDPQFQQPALEFAPEEIPDDELGRLRMSAISELLKGFAAIVEGKQPGPVGTALKARQAEIKQQTQGNKDLRNQLKAMEAAFNNKISIARFEGDFKAEKNLLAAKATNDFNIGKEEKESIESSMILIAKGAARRNPDITDAELRDIAVKSGMNEEFIDDELVAAMRAGIVEDTMARADQAKKDEEAFKRSSVGKNDGQSFNEVTSTLTDAVKAFAREAARGGAGAVEDPVATIEDLVDKFKYPRDLVPYLSALFVNEKNAAEDKTREDTFDTFEQIGKMEENLARVDAALSYRQGYGNMTDQARDLFLKNNASIAEYLSFSTEQLIDMKRGLGQRLDAMDSGRGEARMKAKDLEKFKLQEQIDLVLEASAGAGLDPSVDPATLRALSQLYGQLEALEE